MPRLFATNIKPPLARRTSEVAFPRLAGWKIVQKLGTGAFSEVYLAHPQGAASSQQASYALKILGEEYQTDANLLKLFCRDAQVGRKVTSPHVVPILAANLSQPPYFLVMPFLEGCTLRKILEADSRPVLPIALWIVRQMAEGLQALFAAGWTHGDIKPANTIVAPSGHVSLIDLAFARRLDENAATYRFKNLPLLGTPSYLAPEVLTSVVQPDIRADIYSLGVILYQMLAGRLPFDATDAGELALQHRQQTPLDLRLISPQLPLRVVRLVQAMLAKEPLRRPQTPAELASRLSALEIETFAERASA